MPRKQVVRTICGLLLVLLVALAGFAFFLQQVRGQILSDKRLQMQEVSAQITSTVQVKCQDAQTLLKALGDLVAAHEDIQSQEVIDLLGRYEKETEFLRISIVTPDQTYYTSDGQKLGMSDSPSYALALQGEPVVTGIYDSKVYQTPCFDIAVPLKQNGRTVGSIAGTYSCETFASLLDLPVFDGLGFLQIFEPSGRYITPSVGRMPSFDTIGEYLERVTFGDGYSLSVFEEDVAQGRDGFMRYTSPGGSAWYCYYQPIGGQSWYLATIVRARVVDQAVNEVVLYTVLLSGVVAVCLCALIVYIFVMQRRHLKTLQAAQTALVEANRDLKLSYDRYRIALSNTEHVVFECDLVARSEVYAEQALALYALPSIHAEVPEANIDGGFIHPEDVDAYRKMYAEIYAGAQESGCTVRVRARDGRYVWNELTMKTIYDEQGRAVRAIGFMENVQDETEAKKAMQVYRDQARRDLSTGAYNKEATRLLVSHILSGRGDSLHALCMLDVDRFKQINDRYGHLAGDTVLRELAAAAHRLVRESDLVGRVGGDEFVVFLTGVRDRSAAEAKAEELCRSAAQIVYGDDTPCSVSLGIALFPQDGRDFETLYQHADEALYTSKQRGGGRYTVYGE